MPQTEKQKKPDYTYILNQDTVRCHLIHETLIADFPYLLEANYRMYLFRVRKFNLLTGKFQIIGLIYFPYSSIYDEENKFYKKFKTI